MRDWNRTLTFTTGAQPSSCREDTAWIIGVKSGEEIAVTGIICTVHCLYRYACEVSVGK